jgi:transposase
MVREEITDAQWEQLRPLLPPQKPKTGRPNHDHRTVLSGIVWILRTGAPWRDLPACFGSYKTVSSRFYRWRKAGIWQRILKLLVVLLTQGQRHEHTVFAQLMECGAIKRAGRGRPRLRPKRVCGDKGYSSGAIRRYVRQRGIKALIPRKKNERPQPRFDRTAYRERNVVERLINRLKRYRRIATRYEKRAANYLAMWIIAAILDWL